MKVFYINLDERIDRRRHMERLLSEMNLNYNRFQAVKPLIEEINSEKYSRFCSKLTPNIKWWIKNSKFQKRALGLIGNYISHYNIHRLIREDDCKFNTKQKYLILEDDCNFTKESLIKAEEISLKKEWDIIRGARKKEKAIRKFQNNHKASRFPSRKPHLFHGGSHFCLFKESEKILNFLNQELLYGIDAVYSTSVLDSYWGGIGVSILQNLKSDIPKTC